jgi:chaperonin GroES
MSGEMPSQNTTATTTLAMIEQGLKVFTGIYKRVFRSLKSEFKKLYRLNNLYLNEQEYFRVLDNQLAVFQKDYAVDDLDVIPVADPTMASEAQRLARAQALLQTMEMNPDPMGKIEILQQYYDAIGAKNLDKLIDIKKITEQMANPGASPDSMRFQLDTQKAKDAQEIKLHELEHAEMELIARIQLIEAQVDQTKALTMKTLADAEAVEPGQQLEQYKAYAADLATIRQHERELKKLGMESEESGKGASSGSAGEDTEGAPAGVAESPSNQESNAVPTGSAPSTPGLTPERTNLDAELSGSDGNADYAAIGENLRNESNAGNIG